MAEPKDSRGPGALPTAVASNRASGIYAVGGSGTVAAEPGREARVAVVAQVRLRYSSILDFYETQSVNISRSGMFVAWDKPAAVGSLVDLELALADGLLLLKGRGEVVRVTQSPTRGMGIRFTELDGESRKCLERIVATNEREGRVPDMALDFGGETRGGARATDADKSNHPLRGATRVQPGLSVTGHELQVRLTPLTVGYFTNNPLINIRLGGFVIPLEEEVSLGTAFDVAIADNDGVSLFHGRGKVVAKHERRIGIRLADVDKAVLARLQAEVAKLSPGGR